VISVGATMGPTAATPTSPAAPEQIGVWPGFPAASQTASLLTLLAPGTGIVSSVPGTGFSNTAASPAKTGTSQAAPHVAGAFAVLKALEPLRSVAQIRDTLITTGQPFTDTRPASAITTARLQLDAAVEARLGRPLEPSNLQIPSVTGTSIRVSWTDNSRSETEFRITATPLNNPLLAPRRATAGANATTTTVQSLHPDTDYAVKVESCNGANQCAQSVRWPVRTLNTLPCTPLNFRGGAVTTTGITVEWDLCPSKNAVAEFKVRTNATATQKQVTPTFGPALRSASFTGLSAGTGYYFYISACNATGHCSPESSMLWVVTQSPGPPPAAPTNLHVDPCLPGEICFADRLTLSWNDNANNEDRFEFEWTIAQAGVPPANGSWNTVVLSANDESHSLLNSSFSSGLLYLFRVRACNATCSGYSNTERYTVP
jgi:hypothetical protein